MTSKLRSRALPWLALAAALATLPAALPFRHLRLVKSAPAADEVLAASPTAITLWFSQAPTLRLTRITLLDAAGAKLPLGAVKAGPEENTAMADLSQPISTGSYTISWVSGSPDGHVVRGKIAFSVGAAAPAAAATR
ncbi:MAG TPA: copper resistance CopC family protein [Gemmatimonadales bacterium]|nr:copper resistance CopC family protein [Gemmatimonadales bacterium]